MRAVHQNGLAVQYVDSDYLNEVMSAQYSEPYKAGKKPKAKPGLNGKEIMLENAPVQGVMIIVPMASYPAIHRIE